MRCALQGGASKPAAGKAAGGGITNAGGVGVGLEEEIKKLQRAQKFNKLDEKDEKKLEGRQAEEGTRAHARDGVHPTCHTAGPETTDARAATAP